jgi:hypothetical protein
MVTIPRAERIVVSESEFVKYVFGGNAFWEYRSDPKGSGKDTVQMNCTMKRLLPFKKTGQP